MSARETTPQRRAEQHNQETDASENASLAVVNLQFPAKNAGEPAG